jgi:hypothetical protein
MLNKSQSQTQRILRILRDKKLSHMKEFKVKINNGVVRDVAHHYIDPKVFKQ